MSKETQLEKLKLSIPRGFRDFMPADAMIRQEILNIIKSVFEMYGFLPLQTPALEMGEILSAKGAGGPEILKEAYIFEDKALRKVGLRYDLTVPFARVIAMNPNISLPFKRYQIGRVWRYGDISKSRFREFWQADIDTAGSESMAADAEILACAILALTHLGFKDFVVRINNRKILTALAKHAGIEEEKIPDAFRAIDKLDKIGLNGVKEELQNREISEDGTRRIIEFLEIKGEPSVVLKKAGEFIGEILEGKEGLDELKQIVFNLSNMGIKSGFVVDISLARGFDYYTGPIFEVSFPEMKESIAGGGRYDDMIGLFLGKKVEATGISLGVERIIDVMKNRGMIKPLKTNVKVFVANVNEKVKNESIKITQMLRENQIPTDFDLRDRSLRTQLEHANSLEIPYVIIVGPEEIQRKSVKLRDMKIRTEREIKINELVETLSSAN